jgi:hypothetical protein
LEFLEAVDGALQAIAQNPRLASIVQTVALAALNMARRRLGKQLIEALQEITAWKRGQAKLRTRTVKRNASTANARKRGGEGRRKA